MAAIKRLSIITYNVTSILRRVRRTELEETLRSEKCNIGLLQETRLKEKHKMTVSGRRVLKCEKGVGTAIVVDKCIRASQIIFEELTEFNFTAAEIKMNGQRTLVMSLYIPCQLKVEIVQSGFEKLGRLISRYKRFIVGGDMNARHPKWNNAADTMENTNGKYMVRWLDTNRHIVMMSPEENTFNGITKLDHFLVDVETARRSNTPKAIDTANQHMLVKLWTDNQTEKEKEKFVEIRDYARANWKEFKKRTALSLKNLLLSDRLSGSIQDIDETIELATGLVNKAADETIPLVKIGQGRIDPLPNEIVALMARRKKAWRQKKTPSNNQAFKDLMKEMIKDLTKEINSKLKEFHDDKVENIIRKVNTTRDTFKVINSISGRKAGIQEPKLVNNGVEIWESEVKAEMFKTELEAVFRKCTPPNPILEEIERVWKEYDETVVEQQLEQEISVEEIGWLIKSTNRKKSAGDDNISNLMIKKLPEEFSELSAVLFNNCLAKSYFPRKWKTAIITPIPKTGNAKTVKEYRPIHLLSNWGKLLEGVLLSRMKTEDGDFIGFPDTQFAYRRAHSAVNAADWLLAELRERKERGFTSGVCAMDISKAFDNVWHEGLIYKVGKSLKCENTTRMIRSFLMDRKAVVKIGTSFSSEFRQDKGVPQGSKLGPVLYNLYTADLGIEWTERSGTLTYADDTLIWSSGNQAEEIARSLEEKIVDLSVEMNKWGIKVNKEKTKYIVVENGKTSGVKKKLGSRGLFQVQDEQQTGVLRRKGRRRKSIPEVTFTKEDTVETSKAIKYLGIQVNGKINETDAVKHAAKKGRMAESMLYWILKRPDLEEKLKMATYKQLIRPVLTYGAEIWKEDTNIKELTLLERKILRTCTGMRRRPDGKHFSNAELYERAKIKTLNEVIDERRKKYEERRENHPNVKFRDRMDVLEKRRTIRFETECQRLEAIRRQKNKDKKAKRRRKEERLKERRILDEGGIEQGR